MYDPQLFKSVLLNLLDHFVGVCERNGLKYYLGGGSVLGAVRHKGMIPWDDDIDINMPREDYERLQRLPDSVWGDNYRLASWKKTPRYRYDFLKLEALNTTLIEKIHPDYVGGLFIDIFPLDRYSSDESYIKMMEEDLKGIYSKIHTCVIKHDNECNSLFELLILKLRRLFYNHRKTVNTLERIAMASGEEGEMLADFHNYFYAHGGWPADFYGEGVKMEFEGKEYYVPSNWDAYLTHVYGDYMTPPPIEKRYGHLFNYINCERRLSKQELKVEFRHIHKKYAYHISINRRIRSLFSVFYRKCFRHYV